MIFINRSGPVSLFLHGRGQLQHHLGRTRIQRHRLFEFANCRLDVARSLQRLRVDVVNIGVAGR